MQEIISRLRSVTDISELKDIAMYYEVSLDDIIHLHNMINTSGTRCENCKYIDCKHTLPCQSCKRLAGSSNSVDYFQEAHKTKGF